MTTPTTFRPNGLVTLTTDFGTEDGWVGAMKGVCLSIAPRLALHDLAHALPPQDLVRAGSALAAAVPYFPAGTTHLAVVDPGVGTARAAIVALRGGHALVGPDNHIFDEVLARLDGPLVVRRIEATAWPDPALAARVAPQRSATFHGRDVFAPTAAALASGLLAPDDVGPLCELAAPTSGAATADARRAMVKYIDRFGNVVTTLRALPAALVLPDGRRARAVRTYADAAPGEVVCLLGSDGLVELAVRDGSAAAVTALERGMSLALVD